MLYVVQLDVTDLQLYHIEDHPCIANPISIYFLEHFY